MQVDRNVFAVVATDSRGKSFDQFELPYPGAYTTIPVVKGGYKIHQLENEVCNVIKDIDQDDVIFIFLAAGINDCTYRLRHDGGRELVINNDIQVASRLHQFREAVYEVHDNVLIDIATIPIVSFAQSQAHYTSIKQLK